SPRLPAAGLAGRALHSCREDRAGRGAARRTVPRAAERAGVDREAAHGRPCPGRMAHRPDDPPLRGPRQRARAGPAPDRSWAVSLPKLAAGYLKVAHRGASALAPENSLAALDAALAAE